MEKQYIKPQITWNQEKINYLINNYPDCTDKKKMAVFLGCTYPALKSAARRFGVKSETDNHFYKLRVLFDDSYLSYYWMGFISADGNLSNQGELRVTLSIKDKNHLNKLAKLLGTNVYSRISRSNKFGDFKCCAMSCKDTFYGKLLIKKFTFSHLAKTYNPPLSLVENNDFFLCYLLGFIDGDGTFSKNKYGVCSFIRIELHNSWKPFLEKIQQKLFSLNFEGISVGTNSRGYSWLRITRYSILQFFKRFGQHHNLPLLERKWCSVDTQKPAKRITNYSAELNSGKFFQIKNI